MNNMIEIRPGRRIHIAEYKKDPQLPTIFMIHGLGGRGQQWREQIQHLQGRYNLIVPDMLGHGESEKPQPNHHNLYDFQEFGRDLQLIFEKYAGKTNYIFGHSYGGALATWLATTNQARVQKLFLVTPVSCQPFSGVPLTYLLPVSLLEYLRGSLDKTFEKLALAPTDSPALVEEERRARRLNPMYVIKATLQGMRAIPYIAVNDFQMPSLVVSGKLDHLIPVPAVQAFYGNLPQGQMFVLDNAAHLVHLEQSTEVNGLLDRFLGGN